MDYAVLFRIKLTNVFIFSAHNIVVHLQRNPTKSTFQIPNLARSEFEDADYCTRSANNTSEKIVIRSLLLRIWCLMSLAVNPTGSPEEYVSRCLFNELDWNEISKKAVHQESVWDFQVAPSSGHNRRNFSGSNFAMLTHWNTHIEHMRRYKWRQ